MNSVWLCLQPPPERPERDSVIDVAYIRGFRTALLPWKERRDGPHTWALYAFVSGEYDGPVEVLRGADEGVRATVARKLAQVLAAERAAYPASAAVMVTIGEETPDGFVFHVERQNSPEDPRLWWPMSYRERIEEQERQAAHEDVDALPLTGGVDSETFWDDWITEIDKRRADSSAPEDEESEGWQPKRARMPWDEDHSEH